MREAYAWLQNRLVGRFFEGSDGVTRFEYAPEDFMPISLSLPLDGSWQADAPGAFLDGLLPDNDSEREAMRRWFGAASADPLDLLVATDVTGGLCFTSVPDLGGNHVPSSRVRKGKRHCDQGLSARARLDDVAVRRPPQPFRPCEFAGQIRFGTVRRPLDLAERQASFDPYREAAP